MNTNESVVLRQLLVDAIRGHQAHIEFDSAVDSFPKELRGKKLPGAPHTAWQLVEHMRIAQHDILEFSRNPKHKSPEWPEGYWPKSDAPPSETGWDETVKAFKNDAIAFNQLVQDLTVDLFEPFEHGDGQNLLREALLTASHNSYHLGQLVFLKKTLGGDV